MSQSRDQADDGLSGDRSRSTAELTSMMRQGRSFSGREKNCCFLNTLSQDDAEGRFANISAASGLDFPDDGRAVASLDWDLDGDLDIWITNRNAPRLRLMRNDTEHQNHFVAFRLVGNGSSVNRDAIGARMEVTTEGEPNIVRAKTLCAGDAFLAQSSKWLHFGLGEHDQIQSIRVRWPDGTTEEFGPVTPNRRYRIVQSAGQIEDWESPARELALAPGTPVLPERSSTARVPLLFPLRVPSISYRDFDGLQRDLPIGERPLLINLWGSWCVPCVAELQEFKARYREFSDAGVEVVALSVDRLGINQNGGDVSDVTKADQQMIADLDPPYLTGRATAELVDILQLLHDLVIHSRQTLPIPTSILVDQKGRLLAIYKGAIALDQALADFQRSGASFAERKLDAAMLKGEIIRHERLENVARRSQAHTLFQAGFGMRRANRIEDAIDYFSDAIVVSPESIPARLYLADALKEAKRHPEAVAEYRNVLKMTPDRADVHFNLANTLREMEQVEEALKDYKNAVRINPDYFEAHTNCAIVLSRAGRVEEALEHYQEAVRIRPNSARSRQDLANALLSLNQLEKAESQLKQASQFAPGDVDVQRALGKVLVQQKRYAEALPWFESAVRLRPDSAIVHIELGNLLKLDRRYQEAAKQYQVALRISPKSAETHNNLGAVLLAQDRIAEALSHFQTAIEINPKIAAAHRNLGRTLQYQGDFDKAIQHFQAALEIDPAYATARYDLGTTQLLLNRPEQAVLNLERAVQQLPNDALAHRELGRALITLGKLDEGIGEYRKSLQLKPNDLQTLNNLAWLLATSTEENIRDGQQAVLLAKRAARLTHHEDPRVLDTLAAAFAEVGDFQKAILWQNKAIDLSPTDQTDDGRYKLNRYQSGMPFRQIDSP